MDPQEHKEGGRRMGPAMWFHVACCGGLLLFVLVGSAGFAAIGAFAGDPVVQTVALAGVATLLVVWWSRRRSGSADGTVSEGPPRTRLDAQGRGPEQ